MFIFYKVILCSIEFRMLDENGGCSRMVWNSSQLRNSGWMSSSLCWRQHVPSCWLGAKERRRADLLVSDINRCRDYNGAWIYYSLWTGSNLQQLVILFLYQVIFGIYHVASFNKILLVFCRLASDFGWPFPLFLRTEQGCITLYAVWCTQWNQTDCKAIYW